MCEHAPAFHVELIGRLPKPSCWHGWGWGWGCPLRQVGWLGGAGWLGVLASQGAAGISGLWAACVSLYFWRRYRLLPRPAAGGRWRLREAEAALAALRAAAADQPHSAAP
jgi:hypothetical protein